MLVPNSYQKEHITTELNLCKDCNHFKTKLGKIEVCTDVVKGVDYEYGNNVYFYAYTQRYPYGSCKPQALLFEPKLSLLDRLKNIFRKRT